MKATPADVAVDCCKSWGGKGEPESSIVCGGEAPSGRLADSAAVVLYEPRGMFYAPI